MIFEFQYREDEGEGWREIGAAATAGQRFDINEAATILRGVNGGHLPEAQYRIRAPELKEARWCRATVDRHGIFRRILGRIGGQG